jgi:TetR/AcrR family hemagglutinin/protease transcriptional regulator
MTDATTRQRKRAQRLPPEERRRRLLGSAIATFARLGVDSTVHADVARAAGVSVPTMFTYFPVREALISAVIDEVERFLLHLMEQSANDQPSAAAAIRAILEAFAAAADEHADYIKVWMDWSTHVAEPTWSRYEVFQDRVLERLAALIDQGKASGEIRREVDATMGAHLIMGSGHMIAQMKFRQRDDRLVENFIQTLIGRSLFYGTDTAS